MEKDSNIISDLFDQFCIKYEHVNQMNNLNYCLFAFGVQHGSSHFKGDHPILFKKMNDLIKKYPVSRFDNWDAKLFLRVFSGKDDQDFSEEDYGGLVYWEYGIKRATELNRPDWGLFLWFGVITGKINSGEEDESELFRCLNFFSISFLEKNKNDLIYLYNYFAENGKELNLQIENGKALVRFEKKEKN